MDSPAASRWFRLERVKGERALIVLLLCFGAAIRWQNLATVISRTADESVYTYQANVWLQSGRPGLQSLVAKYQSDPKVRLYPMPTRAGTIRLLAAVMTWTQRRDIAVGALISCIASILSLVVAAFIGIRFLPTWATPPALLIYSVFPPELVIARRTWSDALVELAALLLIWLVCEVVRNPRRWQLFPAIAAVGSLAVTLKEPAAIPYSLSLLFTSRMLLYERNGLRQVLLLMGFVAGGALLCVMWLASMAGSLADLIQVVFGIVKANAVNPYALKYSSGPGYLLLEGLWMASPSTALLSACGLYSTLQSKDIGDFRWALRWIAGFTTVNVAIAMIVPHWLNLRYVSVAFGTYSLLGGLGVRWVFLSLANRTSGSRRRLVLALGVLSLIMAALTDLAYFDRVFVRGPVADLPIALILTNGSR